VLHPTFAKRVDILGHPPSSVTSILSLLQTWDRIQPLLKRHSNLLQRMLPNWSFSCKQVHVLLRVVTFL